MDSSIPGFPILHYLREFAQSHVHQINDTIQPSHPLSSSSPPAFSLSQHESFPMSRLFISGSQSIGASASVLPLNIQDGFPLGLTGMVFLQSKGLSRVFSNTTVQKHQFFSAQPSLMVQLPHPYMTTGKTIALTIQTSIGKVMSLHFNMLSRLVTAFLLRSVFYFHGYSHHMQ